MVATETNENPLAVLAKSEVAEDIAAEVNVPREIKQFVEVAHVFWKNVPRKWRKVLLADEETVADVVTLARKYAKSIDLTFRVQKHDGDPKLLRYKVTDKVKKDGPAAEETNG